MYTPGPAEKRYGELKADRQPYIERADQCARLTITRFETAAEGGGRTPNARLRTTWNSIGAPGVNNIAAKLLLTTMPPEAAMFRFKTNEQALAKAQQQDIKSDIDQALSSLERNTTDKVEACGDRGVVYDLFKRGSIGGNALLNVFDEGSRVIPLHRYVVQRDLSDNLLQLIAADPIAPEALPPDILKAVSERGVLRKVGMGTKGLTVYTHLSRRGDQLDVYQEICGVRVNGSEGSYPVDRSPWIPYRFYSADAEAYGRSYIEELLGSLNVCENLSKAITEGAAAAARLLTLVNPNGVTRASDIADKPNGSVITGTANDISTFQLDKARDFQTAMSLLQRYEERLEKAFLLQSGVQRPGERVTAEEIRYVAGELDDALGGVYTIASREFQRPYVNARLHLMEMGGEMPRLPRDIVRPTVLTGYDALGRQTDKKKLVSFSQTAVAMVGQDNTAKYLNPGEALKRLATADQIDPVNLVRTEEEVAEIEAREQQAMMAAQLGPEALKQVGNMAQGASQ